MMDENPRLHLLVFRLLLHPCDGGGVGRVRKKDLINCSDLQYWCLFRQSRLFPVGALRFMVLISFSWHLPLLIKNIEFTHISGISCSNLCSLETVSQV